MEHLYLYLDNAEESYSLGLSYCPKQSSVEDSADFTIDAEDLLAEWRYFVDS